MTLKKKTFENIVGQGENAGNQHFLLFPHSFSTLPKTNFSFSVTFSWSSASAFALDQSKILSFDKEVIYNARRNKYRLRVTKINGLTHSHTMTPFDAPGKQAF